MDLSAGEPEDDCEGGTKGSYAETTYRPPIVAIAVECVVNTGFMLA